MSLRNKLAGALARCDGCCLDDDDDRRVVLDTLQDEIIGPNGMEFSIACEALRWFVSTGPANDRLRDRAAVLLKALGEA